MFSHNFHEFLPSRFRRFFQHASELKVDLWNAFVDSGLTGICDDDCSVIPRILPLSSLPAIKRTVRDLMLFLMRLLSLPPRELETILPPTPITDYLIRELSLLKHPPRRLTGSVRFDMAIVGKPSRSNPPKLFEVNEIGFDGTGRSSFIQETLLRLIPALREKVVCFDTAASEVRNMRRLGADLVRFQYADYNWEEEVILRKARENGLGMRLVSPTAFGVDTDDDCPLLTRERVALKDGRLRLGKDKRPPDAFQVSYSFELADFKEAPAFFADLIRSQTPHYSPFYTSLIAPKTILAVLSDRALVRRLVGAAAARRLAATILPAHLLDGRMREAKRQAPALVCKYADGMGGEKDFIGNEMRPMLRRIPRRERNHWVIQERVHMNTMRVDGILSRSRRVIADLGVYVHYDWNGRAFTNLAVGGFITRATNRSLKVNVSGGGIQVPVLFDRTR
jgi:hypothetical protein